MDDEKYTMIFQINKKTNAIRILGKEFFKNNSNKGKIINSNKKIKLIQGILHFNNFIDHKLKIKMILSKDCYNKSYMFKDCSFLTEINFHDKIYKNEKKEKDSILNNQHYLDVYFNKSNNEINSGKNNEDMFNDEKTIFTSSEIQELPKKTKNLKNENLWKTKISVMNEIFSNCSALIYLPDNSDWDTINVIDMSKIFYNCRKLSFLSDISKWNTCNVIDMNKMFYNCTSLKSISDISKRNTKNVSNIDGMFYNCISMISVPDISKFKYNLDKFVICLSLKNQPRITKVNQNKFKMKFKFEKYYAIIKIIYEKKGKKNKNF